MPAIELTVSYGLKAHSAMFDFARMMAPAARIRCTMNASVAGMNHFIASEPPVVCRSLVS